MNGRHTLRFAALLLAAVLLGWLLPVALFRLGDGMEEGKSSAVQISQVDLSFQSDLDTASRLRLTNRSLGNAEATSLERGVYLQPQDIKDISEEFLCVLTGARLSLSDCNATPLLLSFPDEGSIIAWDVDAYSEGGWSWEALIDDQTGVILRCSLRCSLLWDSLFHELGDAPDAQAFLSARLAQAVRSHFNLRLDAALDCSAQEQAGDELTGLGKLVLSENGAEQYRLPYIVSLEHDRIALN